MDCLTSPNTMYLLRTEAAKRIPPLWSGPFKTCDSSFSRFGGGRKHLICKGPSSLGPLPRTDGAVSPSDLSKRKVGGAGTAKPDRSPTGRRRQDAADMQRTRAKKVATGGGGPVREVRKVHSFAVFVCRATKY